MATLDMHFAMRTGRSYFGSGLRSLQGLPIRHAYMDATIRVLTRSFPNRPLRLLEIGSWAGGSTVTWAKALARHHAANGVIYCVDPWEEYLDLEVNNDPVYADMNAAAREGTIHALFRHNIEAEGVASVVREFRGTSAEILPLFRHRTFDLVFIDGAHDHASVSFDIEQACRLVREGGIVCGDDLERQIGKAPMSKAKVQRDVESGADFVKNPGGGYHPGVTMAVWEHFGKVDEWEGYWTTRKVGDKWRSPALPEEGLEVPPHLRAPAAEEAGLPIQVLESYRGYNIIQWRDRMLAVQQSQGAINLFQETVGEREIRPAVLLGDSVTAVYRRIDAECDLTEIPDGVKVELDKERLRVATTSQALAEKQSQAAHLEEQLIAISDELAQAKENVSSLSNDAVEQSAAIAELDRKTLENGHALESERTKAAELAVALEAETARSTDLSTDLDTRAAEIETLAGELLEAKAVKAKQATHLEAQAEEVERLATELVEAQAGQASEAERAGLQTAEVERLATELVEAQAGQASEAERAGLQTAEVERLGTELAEARAGQASEAERAGLQTAEVERLAAELAAAQAAQASESERAGLQTAEVERLAAELAAAQAAQVSESERAGLQTAEVERLAAELAAAQAAQVSEAERAGLQTAEVERLAVELAEAQAAQASESERARLQTVEVERLAAEIGRLEAQLSQAESAHVEQHGKVQALAAELEALTVVRGDLERHLNAESSALAERSGELEESVEAVARLESLVAGLRDEIANLTKRYRIPEALRRRMMRRSET
jgi:hypothetical protein